MSSFNIYQRFKLTLNIFFSFSTQLKFKSLGNLEKIDSTIIKYFNVKHTTSNGVFYTKMWCHHCTMLKRFPFTQIPRHSQGSWIRKQVNSSPNTCFFFFDRYKNTTQYSAVNNNVVDWSNYSWYQLHSHHPPRRKLNPALFAWYLFIKVIFQFIFFDQVCLFCCCTELLLMLSNTFLYFVNYSKSNALFNKLSRKPTISVPSLSSGIP